MWGVWYRFFGAKTKAAARFHAAARREKERVCSASFDAVDQSMSYRFPVFRIIVKPNMSFFVWSVEKLLLAGGDNTPSGAVID